MIFFGLLREVPRKHSGCPSGRGGGSGRSPWGEGVESGAAAAALNTEQYLHSEEPSVLQLCKRWYLVAIFSIIRELVTSRRTILGVFWPKSDF